MSYLWYLLWVAATSLWVLIDARSRNASRYWIAANVIAGPLALAAYIAVRPLRTGESREGGRAWQVCSKLVLTWTALLAFAALWNVLVPFADWIGIGIAWAVVTLPALAVGLALKRGTTEYGPVVTLAPMAMGAARCERTAE